MGQVTSLFAWKIIRQAHESLDKAEHLRSLGIDPDAPVDPAIMVSAEDYYSFLERIARADPHGTDLPLRTGASMRSDDYGAFGLAWKSAPTLGGSYGRAERYARVLGSVATYEVEGAQDAAFMHLRREGERRLGLRLSNEATIASIFAISQEVSTRPIRPLAIHFKHPRPGDTTAHERHFGCPVHFGSDRDALLVSREALAVANRLGDERIAQFFDAHLEEALSQVEDDSALDHRVRIQVSQSLSGGVPTMSDIATRLGMSGRTLQRRLSDRGLSFQGLVDEARRQLAERLLQTTDYALAEIAFLTGFSDQSTFTRAFKRWSGGTPRSFRIKTQT